MKLPSSESLTERRAILTAQIARQRGELAGAYRDLGKPIHYAEYGLRSFGFLRKNPWVFIAFPAVFNVGATLLGLRKKKPARLAPSQRQSIEARPKGFVGHAMKWGGYGVSLFRLYRRVRPFFL